MKKFKFTKYRFEECCVTPDSESPLSMEEAIKEIESFPVADQYVERSKFVNSPRPQLGLAADKKDFLNVIFRENGKMDLFIYYKVGNITIYELDIEALKVYINSYYTLNHRSFFVGLVRNKAGLVILGSTFYQKVSAFLWGI